MLIGKLMNFAVIWYIPFEMTAKPVLLELTLFFIL